MVDTIDHTTLRARNLRANSPSLDQPKSSGLILTKGREYLATALGILPNVRFLIHGDYAVAAIAVSDPVDLDLCTEDSDENGLSLLIVKYGTPIRLPFNVPLVNTLVPVLISAEQLAAIVALFNGKGR